MIEKCGLLTGNYFELKIYHFFNVEATRKHEEHQHIMLYVL